MAPKLKRIVTVAVVAAIVAAVAIVSLFLLSPDKGILKLECLKTIELSIDGKPYGTGTAFEVTLPVGSHEYTGTMEGLAQTRMTLSGTFNIARGKTSIVTCGADPKVTFVSTPPGADVAFDSDNPHSLGKTPVDVNLPPGTYTFIINLGGQAKRHGPLEITFDQTRKVEVFFGKEPKTGSSASDAVNITSTPPGIQIIVDDELAGITPVSFSGKEKLYARSGDTVAEIPRLYPRQHVWLHPSDNFEMAVSMSPIESSGHAWFVKGGFFDAFVEDGFIKAVNNAGQTIKAKLPQHDTVCDLSLHGSQIVFTGIDKDILVMQAFDSMTLKPTDARQKESFVGQFAKPVQSQDGSLTRYFASIDGNLCEFDTQSMKVLRLAKMAEGMHLRRIGETTDFGVGAFSADGTCTGVYGRRYAWELDRPHRMAEMTDAMTAIIVFFAGSDLVGFNSGSGQTEWQVAMQEEPLTVFWNANEQVWIAESLDSQRHYLIDPLSGMSTPLEKGNSFVQENPYPGFRKLGIASVGDQTIQLLSNPVGILKAVSYQQELWSIQCDEVYSTKGFNPLTDIGSIFIRKNGRMAQVDLSTGKEEMTAETETVAFLENGAMHCPGGIYSGGKKIFYGKANVRMKGNSLRIVLEDGSTCLVLP